MNKKSIASLHIILLLLIFTVMATGCTDINGKLATKGEVTKKVSETVPSEEFQLVSVDHHNDERPKKDIYTFTTDRGMSFEAVSTLSPIGIDSATIGYNKAIRVAYADAVHNLYADRVDKVFENYVDDRNAIYYESFDDLSEVARVLAKANEIYSEELSVNSSEWLKSNPLCKVYVYFEYPVSEDKNDRIMVAGIDINAARDYESMYDYLTYRHVQEYKAGKIVDDSIPQSQIDRVHVKLLEKIECEGISISYDAYSDAKENRLINQSNLNTGGDPFSCYYYYPWDSYIVILNVGLTDETYCPRLFESYAKALGYKYKIKYKEGKIGWSTGSNTWVSIAENDDQRHVCNYSVYKDKIKQDIDFITFDDELSPVNCTYLVGISVDDFSQMFDLEYEIDEDNSVLRFNKPFMVDLQ